MHKSDARPDRQRTKCHPRQLPSRRIRQFGFRSKLLPALCAWLAGAREGANRAIYVYHTNACMNRIRKKDAAQTVDCNVFGSADWCLSGLFAVTDAGRKCQDSSPGLF